MSTLLVHCHGLLLRVHDVPVRDQGDLVVVVELVELLLQDVVDLLRDVVELLHDVVGLLRDVVQGTGGGIWNWGQGTGGRELG